MVSLDSETHYGGRHDYDRKQEMPIRTKVGTVNGADKN